MTALLDQHTSQLHSKYPSWHLQTSVALTLIQEASLCSRQRPLQEDTTVQNAENNWLWAAQAQWSHLQNNSCTLGSRNIRKETGEGYTSQRKKKDCCEIVSLKNDKEAMPVMFQQFSCLSKTWSRTMPICMLPWKAEISWGPSPRQTTTGNQRLPRGST